MGDLTKNFSRNEFKCKCGKCTNNYIDIRLVKGLQALRDLIGSLSLSTQPLAVRFITRPWVVFQTHSTCKAGPLISV